MNAGYDRLLPALKRTLPSDFLGVTARAVGFVRRLRAITPTHFVWAVVLSRFGAGRPAFEQARQWLLRLSGASIFPRPFQIRFKSGSAVQLVASAFEHAVRPWREAPRKATHPLHRFFADIVAYDASPVRLHDELKDSFKGLRNVASQIKVLLAVSVFGGLPLSAQLVPGCRSDLRLPPPLEAFRKQTLLLFDKGFVSYDLLRQIEHAGLFFLCPMRVHAHAHVIAASVGPAWLKRALKRNPCGIALRKWLPKDKLIRHPLDLTVRVTPSARGADRAPVELRLVILPGPKWQQRPYLTNVDRAIPPAALREIYRLRWQVELTFKELKQCLNLETVPTRDPNAAQVLIWASLLALALSRIVANAMVPLDAAVGLESKLRPAIISRSLRANSVLLQRVLTAPLRLATLFARTLIEQLRIDASRPGPHREDSFARLRKLLPEPA